MRMRIHSGAFPALVAGLMAVAAPSLADSVAVTNGPDGSVIVNGKPCRVVTIPEKLRDDHGQRAESGNSTTMTVGPGGLSGSTSVSPGGSGSSVSVFSGSSSSGAQTSSAAGSDCVIYRHEPSK